MLYIITEGL
jgi:hypothetical protein